MYYCCNVRAACRRGVAKSTIGEGSEFSFYWWAMHAGSLDEAHLASDVEGRGMIASFNAQIPFCTFLPSVKHTLSTTTAKHEQPSDATSRLTGAVT